MRRSAFLLLLALAAAPCCAATPVTVAQLEQFVATAQSKSDKDITRQLEEMQLTERLTTPRLDRMELQLTGILPKRALLALADTSAFLDLPKTDELQLPAPDAAAQGRILSRAADFVQATVTRMPDFLATRTRARFENLKFNRLSAEPLLENYQSLLDRTSMTVQYRNGREVEEPVGQPAPGHYVSSSTGLIDWGVFGPMLEIVISDILHGKMGWGHWEQGPSGPVAVFRYAVPEERSNYTVRYCCFLSSDHMMRQYETVPQYHGEIAVNPETGDVLRLVMKTDLKTDVPMYRADVVVEYGPVEIGGRTYICPLKSIAISTAMVLFTPGMGIYVEAEPTWQSNYGGKDQLKVTSINDVIFDHYHKFQAEMRILPFDSKQASDNPQSGVPAKQP
jgi:hypothetical protein